MEIDEHLEELKELVNDAFLDRHLKCRQRIDEDTLEEVVDKFLSLSCINHLGLSEEDEVLVINYLGSLGIFVRGTSSYYSGICDNYIQTTRIKRNSIGRFELTEEETKRYLEEYQKTKDITLRNEIAEANLLLVRYLSEKYSNLYGVEQEFLESYGAEGLLMAFDTYDPTRGKFESHMSRKIMNYIFCAIAISNLGEDGSSFLNSLGRRRSENTKFFEYFYTKASVEKQVGKKLKDDPELVEIIAHLLEEKGYCKGEDFEELKTRVSFHHPYSYEQIEKNLSYLDDDTLYREALEPVYQEELAEFIVKMEEGLSERRKNIVNNFYGLGGRKCCSETELAKEFNGTRQAVFSYKKRALNHITRKLKSWKVANIRESFLENNNHEYEGNACFAYMKRK